MHTTEISALRRQLHHHAEPGFLEYRTAGVVVQTLRDLNIPHLTGKQAMDMATVPVPPTSEEQEEWARLAVDAGVDAELVRAFRADGTAVVAIMEGNRPGPAWGLRVDMDALPIIESTDAGHFPAAHGFGSNTTYMHACAHDSHTAIGLALASRLADGNFPGTVRILFQPAEEGVRGALPMIRAGVVEGIDRMLAVHLGGDLPTGTVVGGCDGAMATTKWTARFTGEAAHAAASPESGRNALAAAAHATLAILGTSRFAAADTRVNVGTFHAGGGANIIPADATITYETRSSANEVLEEMNRRVEDIVRGSAQMYNVEADTRIYGAAASSIADAARLEELAAAAAAIPAITQFIDRDTAVGGSDDAHLMIREVQKAGGTGAYIMVGASNPAPHHNPRFDVDEAALEIAVSLLERVFRAASADNEAEQLSQAGAGVRS
ncbi:p-aminobenzoyl-glutamate hydrolase subunit AbgA [Arthrobacter tecti]